MWSDWLTPLRWLLRGAALGALCLLLLPATVLCQSRAGRALRAGGRRLDEFMLMNWSGLLCRVFGVQPRVSGRLQPGPVLVVANHISWLDIIALHSTGKMSFVAKAEIDRWPVFGFLARCGGTLFHHRGDPESATGVIAQMRQALARGGRVAIFPEGGILPGEQVKRFHARLFRVAVEAACPVQPVMLRYLRGGERDGGLTFLRGENFMVNILRLLGRPGCLADLRFLTPLPAAGRQRRQLAEQARDQILEAYQSPPLVPERAA